MPAPTGTILYKHIVFEIDGVEYANQSSRSRLVPETPIQTMRTLVPDGVIQDVDSSVWTLEVAGAQIWSTGGLAKALNDNAGLQVDVTLQLKSGVGQPMATCAIIAVPVPFGGDQGQILAFEASFPVIGAPVFGTSV
jgi:hypothetical protein